VIALSAGTQYQFQVAAENDVGLGPFAELAKPVAPRSQFGGSSPHSQLIIIIIIIIISFNFRQRGP